MNSNATFVIAMVLVVIIIVGVVIYTYFSLQSRRRVWSDFAGDLGFNFDPGGFLGGNMKVNGIYHSRQFNLDTYTHTTGVGKNRHTKTYTRVVLAINNRANVSLSLDREGIFSKMGKALGMKDIQTGDSELDKHLVIKGQPETTVQAILSNSNLRQKLLQARSIDIEVTGNQIHYQKQGFEKNSEVLISWFDLLTILADAIERQ